MKKRILPKISREKQSSPAIPLHERIIKLIERIHSGASLWPYNDAVTVKECLKRGFIKRGRFGRRNIFIPLVAFPTPDQPRVPHPYAKRHADLDAAGLRRRKASI